MASKTNPIPLNVPKTGSQPLFDYLTVLSRAVFQLWSRINASNSITPTGTTGAQTINKASGSVNFAPGASSLVVTNDFVTQNSVILVTVGSSDASLRTATAVATEGFFTLYGNAAATGETRVNWMVVG